MVAWLLGGAMVAVALSAFALIYTDSQSVRDGKPALRKAAVAMWLRLLMVGWVFFVLVPFAVPGGLDGEWAWISEQSLALRGALWALLLPWMVSLWLWQLTAVPVVLRFAGMVGIAVLTFYLGSQLIGPKRSRAARR